MYFKCNFDETICYNYYKREYLQTIRTLAGRWFNIIKLLQSCVNIRDAYCITMRSHTPHGTCEVILKVITRARNSVRWKSSTFARGYAFEIIKLCIYLFFFFRFQIFVFIITWYYRHRRSADNIHYCICAHRRNI